MARLASISGLKGVRERLNRLFDPSRAERFCRLVADKAQEEATVKFAAAPYPGTNDVRVTVEKSGDASYVVKASGTAVAFIEFGAGTTYAQGKNSPYAQGSWSATHSNAIHQPGGYWFYSGEPGRGGMSELAHGRSHSYVTQGNAGADVLPAVAEDDLPDAIADAFRQVYLA